MIRTHRSPEVQRLIRATKGHVAFDLLYLPDEDEMLEGYESLRRMALWNQEKSGVSVPKAAVTMMRWIRDHFGPEADRRAAVRKYGKAATEPPTDPKNSTDRPSSGATA